VTVSAQETVYSHAGNGLTTTFAYGCLVLLAADLVVTVDGVIQSSGYSVTGVGSDSGGTVVFTTAPAAGTEVILRRLLTLSRATDYQQFGDWKAEVINPDYDRLWMAAQQLQEQIDRTLKFPLADAADPEIPGATSRANRLLSFDASGNPVYIQTDTTSAGAAAASAAAASASAAAAAGSAVESASYVSLARVDGRLTLTSGSPADVSDFSKAIVYFSPYEGNRVPLYYGGAWHMYQFSEVSVGSFGTGVYDIFAYYNGTGVALEKVAWLSESARAVALLTLDGVLIKAGDPTRRYIGSAYAEAGALNNHAQKRWLWNQHNRLECGIIKLPSGNWNYTTAAWRSANLDGDNRVDVLFGRAEGNFNLHARASVTNATGAGVAVGICVGGTISNNAQLVGGYADGGHQVVTADYVASAIEGLTRYYLVEFSEAIGTTTWYASGTYKGVTASIGIFGSVMM